MKPVAISAAACRFPGAPNLDAYWERIAAARPAPLASLEERWSLPRARYFSADPAEADRTYLDQAFCLDPQDFSAAPDEDRQEALGKSVVERLLAERGPGLDLARTALVLATNFPGESYFQADAERYLSPFMSPPPALAPASSPERLLRVLAEAGGLGGPRLSIDTACSSSLYALELGIGLLRAGRAEAVVVCGLTGYLPLFLFVGFSRLRALSPEGQIRPFARDASGILLGEGCGALLLERSAPAPLALVRGLGLSSDGNDRSVFAPGAEGQRLAYARAYAGLDPGETDYVEAHGTATAVGDATELATLHAFFGPHRRAPLPVGSVKSLVGHQLAAAGMAALIKGVLMLRHGLLPPHLPVEPHPDLAGTCCELARAAAPWPRGPRPRRVGVSAFGFGGSNAHVVLEEAGAPGATEGADDPGAGSSSEGGLRAAPSAEDALVISDLELVCGRAQGLAEWAECLRREEAPQGAYSPERFGLYRDEAGAPAVGVFFPPRLTIEGAGLRMGPRLLARLDPWQLLLTDLSHRLLQRHESLGGGPEVGVVVLSNAGGSSLQAYRRHVYLSHASAPSPGVRDFLAAETTTEAIASSLGTMCSGYPAFHLDLRAFHETLSGPAGSLREALALAEGQIAGAAGGRCRALLLGAGNLLRGPLQLREGAGQREGEAAGFLLLEREAAALARGARPLARICAQGPDWASVARAAGIAPGTALRIERAEIGPGAALAPGAQTLSGGLGAACGLEALSRALLLGGPGERVGVEWTRGGAPAGALALEILRAPELAAARSERPLEVAFLAAPRPQARGEGGALARPGALPAEARLSPEVLRAYVEETGAALCALLRLQRASLARLTPQAGASPGLAPPREEACGAGPLGEGGDLAAALARLRPRAAQRVLRELSWGDAGGLWGQLVIDEADPYYFDHPLDHAPGVLLVEALVQACEASLAARGAPPVFVRDLQLSFRSFCEKAPAEVQIEERPLGPGRWAFVGKIQQGGRGVLSATLQLATLPSPPAAGSAPSAASEPWPGDPPPELARKTHPENVLSSALRWEGGDAAASFVAREPAPEHALGAGGRVHGPTYLLEVSRQAISQAFARLEPEAFEGARVLLALRISLDAPVWRGAPLLGRIERQPYVKVGELRLGEVRVELHSGPSRLGSLQLKVQNVDAETYRRQRGGQA